MDTISQIQYTISLMLGYTQMTLWLFAMFFYLYEPIRILSSNGLSYDFIYVNMLSYILMAFQDCYGRINPNASFKYEVHQPDCIISVAGVIFGMFGAVLLKILPRKVPKKLSGVFGRGPMISMVVMPVVAAIWTENLDDTMRIVGIIRAVSIQISYIPQFLNNYFNKSTRGFSQQGIIQDLISSCTGITQIFLDHIRDNIEDINYKGFFHDLNYGKFFLNFFTIVACIAFIIQHYCVYNRSLNSNDAISNSDDGKFSTKLRVSEDIVFNNRIRKLSGDTRSNRSSNIIEVTKYNYKSDNNLSRFYFKYKNNFSPEGNISKI